MNRVLYAADCLDVLNDAGKLPTGSVDLIYLDPPFNSNSSYNLPFKSRDRSLKPVEAFEDTWRWRADDDERLSELEKNPQTRPLATIVKFAQGLESGRGKISLAAYLLNMAQRLYAMKRVLKETGSIYLHCDPTASHYLKLLMDAIFGRKNFRNEIVWCYRGMPSKAKKFMQKHDTIMFYANADAAVFNVQLGEPTAGSRRTFETGKRVGYNANHSRMMVTIFDETKYRKAVKEGKIPSGMRESYFTGGRPPLADWWDDIRILGGPKNKERLGYPTQKPLALLERIIKASSNPGDTVLDPFCGCGTTAHAAECLERKWIGIDISRFSTGLVKRRIVDRFGNLNRDDIAIYGTPESPAQARDLAQRDKFEFEKWVCGAMGANGMYKNPGEPGADGGVDGVVELPVIRQKGNKFESQTEYVIIQVKGGAVVPDSVKALSETVRRLGAVAGIMVCFRDQLGTVENQRSKELWADAYKQYPVIQGFSIEDMLADQRPNLPPTWGYKHGGKTSAPQLL